MDDEEPATVTVTVKPAVDVATTVYKTPTATFPGG